MNKKYREGKALHGQEEWKNEKEVAQLFCTTSLRLYIKFKKFFSRPHSGWHRTNRRVP